MHKKGVPTVDLGQLSLMVKRLYSNSVSTVLNVSEPLYGKRNIISFIAVNTGLNYGLMKATLLGDSVNYLAIVPLRSKGLRTTGWSEYQRNRIITLKSIIWSVMPLTSIRMAACSI